MHSGGIYFAVIGFSISGFGLCLAFDGFHARRERERIEREGVTVKAVPDICSWSSSPTAHINPITSPTERRDYWVSFITARGIVGAPFKVENSFFTRFKDLRELLYNVQVRYLPAEPEAAYLVGSAPPSGSAELMGYALAVAGLVVVHVGRIRSGTGAGMA